VLTNVEAAASAGAMGRKNLPQTAANYRANSCPITKGW